MDAMSYTLAFVAGLVSIFSPCVLPLLPVVLGTAVSHHRLGPLLLTAGLALSFLAIGLFTATVGFSLGADGDKFRAAGTILLIVVGVVLVTPPLQAGVALAVGPIGRWTEERFGGADRSGLAGQFCVGVLLGAVWTPCVGPTLGAAAVLAAQGRDLGRVAVTMVLFAIGTAMPLLLLGALSREVLLRWRGRLLATGRGGKMLLGIVLLATGTLLLSGLDKPLETAILNAMPAELSAFATRF
jgi:cytochrome c-type biogenesis protein